MEGFLLEKFVDSYTNYKKRIYIFSINVLY